MTTLFRLYETSVKSFEKEDIYRDERWIVVRPLNQRSAMKYGANTNWCTSTSDPKYQSWYNNDHSFFIYVIDRSKNPPSLEIRNAKVKRYQQLYNDNELDQLDDKEETVGIDLSRIAILIHWENPESEEFPDISMYDANNIDLYEFDYYGIESLDMLPDNVKDAIGIYIDNWVKAFNQKRMVLSESVETPTTNMMYAMTGRQTDDKISIYQLKLIKGDPDYKSWLGWYHDEIDTERILSMDIGDIMEVGGSTLTPSETIIAIPYEPLLINTSWKLDDEDDITNFFTPEMIEKYKKKMYQKRFDL